MSAHARTFEVSGVPSDVPTRVREIAATYDWSGALPERATYPSWKAQQRVKRVVDIVLSAVAIVVLSPVFLLTAVLVRLTSPGPILYRLPVLGLRAREFVTYKFRTMVVDADTLKEGLNTRNQMSGPVFKMRQDPRVTPLGRWLRRYSIDEIPQLWSVLKGDLSLVGPRAPGPHEFVQFEPWQRAKLAVIPGITCLWQVGGRSDLDFEEWMRLDLRYIREWNLLLDLRILVRTIPAVLSGRGAY